MFKIERRTGKSLEQLYEILRAASYSKERWKITIGFDEIYNEVVDRLSVHCSKKMGRVYFLLAAILSEEQGIYIYEYPMEELYPELYLLHHELKDFPEELAQQRNKEPNYVWLLGEHDEETMRFMRICGRIQENGGLGKDKAAKAFLNNRDLTEEMIKKAIEDGWRLARFVKEKLSRDAYSYDESKIVRCAVTARCPYRIS